jgi:hypothetical protein
VINSVPSANFFVPFPSKRAAVFVATSPHWRTQYRTPAAWALSASIPRFVMRNGVDYGRATKSGIKQASYFQQLGFRFIDQKSMKNSMWRTLFLFKKEIK